MKFSFIMKTMWRHTFEFENFIINVYCKSLTKSDWIVLRKEKYKSEERVGKEELAVCFTRQRLATGAWK